MILEISLFTITRNYTFLTVDIFMFIYITMISKSTFHGLLVILVKSIYRFTLKITSCSLSLQLIL